jgi:hypothetical protein
MGVINHLSVSGHSDQFDARGRKPSTSVVRPDSHSEWRHSRQLDTGLGNGDVVALLEFAARGVLLEVILMES